MGKVLKIPAKTEKVTPDELKQIKALSKAVVDADKEAKEAALRFDESQTTFKYQLMQLRQKYKLAVGDEINDATGQITRSP
jgi:hypothetical protein